MTFPETYRNLISAGIKTDWTMGYSNAIGFRCGIAEEFPWFDVRENKTTGVMLQPFHAMDAALFYNMNLKAAVAEEKVIYLINEVKSVGGHFVFLSHNNLSANKGEWTGWNHSMDNILKQVAS